MYIKATEAQSGLIHALSAQGDVILDVFGTDQEKSYLQDNISFTSACQSCKNRAS